MHAKTCSNDYIRLDDAIPAIISKDGFQQAQARHRRNNQRPA